MLRRAALFDKIAERLYSLRGFLSMKAGAGLTDQQLHAEEVVGGLLNIVYDLNLVNLNKANQNFPGIDLGDEKEQIAFQVTGDRRGIKVRETLKKCAEHSHYKVYNKIRIFVLGEKQKRYRLAIVSQLPFKFDPASDVLDFEDLLKAIKHVAAAKMKRIADYLASELRSQQEIAGRALPHTPEPSDVRGVRERPLTATRQGELLFAELERSFDVLEIEQAEAGATYRAR